MEFTRLPILRAVALGCLIAAILSPGGSAGAAHLIVNSVDDADDGACDTSHCSLREAINAANANPGPDQIRFDIAGRGPHTINIQTPLPPLTDDGTLIDGTTEPDYDGQPVVAVRACGSNFGPCAARGLGLLVQSSDNLIRGLSWFGFGIYNPSGDGRPAADSPCAIDIARGSGNRIEANFIGLTPTGTRGGNHTGLRLQSAGQLVIGNVISGNHTGIYALAPDQVIQGNRIGTDPGGTAAVPNRWGVYIDSGGGPSLIGGAGAGEGNLISGNDHSGIYTHWEAPNLEIYGNWIGTNVTGNAALPNGYGVYLDGGYNHFGGPGSGQGNLISGNEAAGAFLSGRGDVIQGNRIGSDASGAAIIPNGDDGIECECSEAIIGGESPAEGNLVLGNQEHGIHFDDLAHNNRVIGNTIHSNGYDGIHTLIDPDVYQNTFSRNSIFDNGGLGIAVAADWSHEALAPPVLAFAAISSAAGSACPGCVVELFIADPDPSGAGEGRTYLTSVTADPGGAFQATYSGVAACDWITATATDAEGTTSEFSANRRTCITLPWPGAVLGIVGVAAVGAVVGAAGSRRWRVPRRLAVAIGGGGGAVVAMMFVGAIVGLRVAAIGWPQSYGELPARPTRTLDHNETEMTEVAAMTQAAAASLTAQPTLSATMTRTPTSVVTPTLAEILATPTVAEVTAVLTQDANCRSGPGSSGYRVITSLRVSDVVAVEGRNPDGTWSFVRRDYADGAVRCWVWNGSLQGEFGDVPVRPVPPTETPTPQVGCWVPGIAGEVCTFPCPSGASGGACTLP